MTERSDTLKISLVRKLDGTYVVECWTNETSDPAVIQEWIIDLTIAQQWLKGKQQ